jgi:DNA-binding NarL/FixJ family response regulator
MSAWLDHYGGAIGSPRVDQLDHSQSALSERVARALGVVALDVTGEMGVVCNALERIGGRSADLVDGEAFGVLEITASEVRFVSANDRTMWSSTLDPGRRRSIHAALAATLTERRHREARAEHLVSAAVGPDANAAQALAELGQEASERGATGDAALLFTRAAGIEPDPEARSVHLHYAADSWWNAGEYDAARSAFSEAFVGSSEPTQRADTLLQLGQLEMYERGPRYARDLFMAASKDVEPHDVGRAANLLVHAASTATLTSDIGGALALARQAEVMAAGTEGTGAIAASLMVAFLSFQHGDTDDFESRFPALSQIADLLLDADEPDADLFLHLVGMTHVYNERWDTGRMYLTAVMHGASRRDRSATAALASAVLAELCWRSGHWAEAWKLATSDLVRDVTLTGARLWLLAFTAHLDAGFGRADDCRARAQAALDEAEPMGFDTVTMWARHALGLLELGLDRPAEAAAHLDRLATDATSHELVEPSAMWWQADHIESLLRSGRRHEAARTLRQFDTAAGLSDRVWAAAASARCHGLLARSSAEAESHFAESLALHARLAAPFELARTLLCRAERRASSPAGTAPSVDLDEAQAIFESLGATSWAARTACLRDAVAGSATSTLDGMLSPAERRVASAVAEGLTNKDVATQLHISQKTVEFHLHNTYVKLGITSRTQLVRLLTSPPHDV